MQLREGGRVLVIAVDIAQQLDELLPRPLVDTAAVLGQAGASARSQAIEIPVCLGDADDRYGEMSAADHRLERREDLLVGEVSGRTEEHEGVGALQTHMPASDP